MLSSGQISKILQTTSLLEELNESLRLNLSGWKENGPIPWPQIERLLSALVEERDILLRELASRDYEVVRLREALHIHEKFQSKVAEGKDFEDVPLPLQY